MANETAVLRSDVRGVWAGVERPEVDGELHCVAFFRSFDGARVPTKWRHAAAPPHGAIHRQGGGRSDDTRRSRRRPSRGTLPPVGRPSWVGVEMAD